MEKVKPIKDLDGLSLPRKDFLQRRRACSRQSMILWSFCGKQLQIYTLACNKNTSKVMAEVVVFPEMKPEKYTIMDAQNFQLTRSYCQKAELNEYSVHGVAVKDYLFSDNPVGIRLDLVTQVVERKKKDDDELAWKKGYYGPSAVWDQPL